MDAWRWETGQIGQWGSDLGSVGMGGLAGAGSAPGGGDNTWVASIVDSLAKLGIGIAQAASDKPVTGTVVQPGQWGQFGAYTPTTGMKIPWGLLLAGGAVLGGLYLVSRRR